MYYSKLVVFLIQRIRKWHRASFLLGPPLLTVCRSGSRIPFWEEKFKNFQNCWLGKIFLLLRMNIFQKYLNFFSFWKASYSSFPLWSSGSYANNYEFLQIRVRVDITIPKYEKYSVWMTNQLNHGNRRLYTFGNHR